ncbi:aminoglycoside phosphotransferase family protein [Parasphingorhabdus litoris]|uniref:aminoglycoside phosphotransferase family protein n=1 Tax=Parasphingorhabdus litoris TaxID=394733 RepID=UPI001E33C0D1|nr:aminoglycoside phosphotransferase family protein [Parasphingorhabdus litoris]
MTAQPVINTQLVTRLVAEQFPQWAGLAIKPVKLNGWDNRTFHLGSDMTVRLPSAERYAVKVPIEQKWLPKLAPSLSFPIPKPLAMGQPSCDYPWNWSVYRWIEGDTADILDECHLRQFARDCARFLKELHQINTSEGPLAGPHNFYRGGSLKVYDEETNAAIHKLKGLIDTEAVAASWKQAISSEWVKEPVWVHGDFSVGNIIVKDRKLAAVIDFGGMGIGDPACDLVLAWTFLTPESRGIFKSHMEMDNETWNRARGWALWKALITLASLEDMESSDASQQKRVISSVLSEGL